MHGDKKEAKIVFIEFPLKIQMTAIPEKFKLLRTALRVEDKSSYAFLISDNFMIRIYFHLGPVPSKKAFFRALIICLILRLLIRL